MSRGISNRDMHNVVVEADEVPPVERPPTPPFYRTSAARGVHTPQFSTFRPRDHTKIASQQPVTHVAWNCDGKKLAVVGTDKAARIYAPDKSMEPRSAATFTGHSDEVDYVSWNPTHPDLFCTSSQRDRRIIFWTTTSSRPIQTCTAKAAPVQTCYAPDGKSLVYVSAGHQLYVLLRKEGVSDTGKDAWYHADKTNTSSSPGSVVVFNNPGDGLLVGHHSEGSVQVMEYPSLTRRGNFAAHIGGCSALAMDPRGRYIASGGYNSSVNLFDTSDWICARSIGISESAITGLSFSHDGEYVAISSGGEYIDICETETGLPLHRVPALASSPTVSWHPSKHIIAYCGITKIKEVANAAGQTVHKPAIPVISLFGPGLAS